MNVAIVDDDKNSVAVLRTYFDRFIAENDCEAITITEFCDGVDFLQNYKSLYDIIFLDIDMPIMDGFRTAEKLREMDSDVFLVFCTVLASYAAEGYKFDAADFMLKPVLYARFSSTMKRILRKLDKSSDDSIAIKTNYGVKYVSPSRIAYVETRGHRLYFHAGETLLSWGTLKDVESLLPKDKFVRINSGCVVNIAYVNGLRGNELDINGNILLASRGCKKNVMQRLAKFFGGGV